MLTLLLAEEYSESAAPSPVDQPPHRYARPGVPAGTAQLIHQQPAETSSVDSVLQGQSFGGPGSGDAGIGHYEMSSVAGTAVTVESDVPTELDSMKRAVAQAEMCRNDELIDIDSWLAATELQGDALPGLAGSLDNGGAMFEGAVVQPLLLPADAGDEALLKYMQAWLGLVMPVMSPLLDP